VKPSGRFHDERFVMNGDSLWFVSDIEADRKAPPADFCAKHFLRWIADRYPVGVWISSRDLEAKLFPRFQAECGGGWSFCLIARHLGRLTKKREREFRLVDGQRKTATEYLICELEEAEVVQLDQARRARSPH
jgi:hypothetical protein